VRKIDAADKTARMQSRYPQVTLTNDIITSGQSNLTIGRIAAAHGPFNGIDANWRHLANTIELVLPLIRPTRVHNSKGKSIGSAVLAPLTAVLYLQSPTSDSKSNKTQQNKA